MEAQDAPALVLVRHLLSFLMPPPINQFVPVYFHTG
jgi:hypothetical protein